MHVDQLMTLYFLLLNPTVKHRNEITKMYRLRVRDDILMPIL